MKAINFQGFSALVTKIFGAYLEDNGGEQALLFLEFAADNSTHAKAIWAALQNANNRKADNGITITTESKEVTGIHLARHSKYRSELTVYCLCGEAFASRPFKCPKCGIELRGQALVTRYKLIHPALHAINDKEEQDFFIVSDDEEMPSDFRRRLKTATGLAILPEWESWLWQKGLEKNNGGEYGFIKQIDATGVFAWKVIADRTNWLHLIRANMGLKVLFKQVPAGYENGNKRIARINHYGSSYWGLSVKEGGEWKSVMQKAAPKSRVQFYGVADAAREAERQWGICAEVQNG